MAYFYLLWLYSFRSSINQSFHYNSITSTGIQLPLPFGPGPLVFIRPMPCPKHCSSAKHATWTICATLRRYSHRHASALNHITTLRRFFDLLRRLSALRRNEPNGPLKGHPPVDNVLPCGRNEFADFEGKIVIQGKKSSRAGRKKAPHFEVLAQKEGYKELQQKIAGAKRRIQGFNDKQLFWNGGVLLHKISPRSSM